MDYMVFQEAINKIDGVINSKVVLDNNELSELHILANNFRSPKQIVRDIETVLLTSYNYKIDRKIISVAQIQTEYDEKLKRIVFDGISLKTSGNMAECTVTLNYEEEEYSVTEKGIKTLSNQRKIIADTTMRVIEKILGQASIFEVIDVIVTENHRVTFVSVLISILNNGIEETMVGSAVVKNDLNEAIVKASLSAINRRIQKSSS